MDLLTLVKEVASAASTQARFANRYWLAMVGFGLVVTLTPRDGDGSPLVVLPWIGKLPPDIYSIMAVVIYSVLAIAFSSAHGQQVRALKLAQRTFESAKGTIPGAHPRDLYDAMRRPSFIRVSPLPQLLQGKSQFFGDSSPLSRFRKGVSTGYYVCLKVIAMVVYAVLPMAGLALIWQRFIDQSSGWWILVSGSVLGLFALVSLALVVWFEGCELVATASHITRRRGEARSR